MGGAFWTKLVGQNATLANWFQWHSQNLTFLNPINPSNVMVLWTTAILKPNRIESMQNLAWQQIPKVGGAEPKVGGAPACTINSTGCAESSDAFLVCLLAPALIGSYSADGFRRDQGPITKVASREPCHVTCSMSVCWPWAPALELSFSCLEEEAP